MLPPDRKGESDQHPPSIQTCGLRRKTGTNGVNVSIELSLRATPSEANFAGINYPGTAYLSQVLAVLHSLLVTRGRSHRCEGSPTFRANSRWSERSFPKFAFHAMTRYVSKAVQIHAPPVEWCFAKKKSNFQELLWTSSRWMARFP